MNRASPASLGRRWFSAIVAVSALFVLLTFLGFLVQGFGGPARPLFWLGLSGENNVGAWWSGMLLLLAAMLAFDGFASPTKRETERRGWLALSMLLLFLSFDELASLHEHLAARSLGQIAALALPLVVLGCYALIQLHRGGLARRHVGLLLVAYVLLGSVPLQEYVQHSREWPSGAIYGLRAAIEEGTEIAALLIFVAVTRVNTAELARVPGHGAFELVGRHGRLAIVAAALLLPLLVGATFTLPYPAGPADWLASSLHFAAALLVVRAAIAGDARHNALAWVGLYLVASVGSNAIRYSWDPELLGMPIALRGVFAALVLVAAGTLHRAAGRKEGLLLLGAAPIVITASALLPDSRLLWWTLPPLAALLLFSVEYRAAVIVRTPAAIEAPTTVAARG